MRSHEIKILTEAKDMYDTYHVFLALNETMNEYRDYVDFWAPRGYRQFVAYADKPVSAIAVIDTPLMGAVPSKAFKIANVATLPESRGSGVSQQLMSFVITHMKDEGYVSCDLNCSKKNERGNAFYAKCGFSNDESFNWRMKIAGEKKETKAKS